MYQGLRHDNILIIGAGFSIKSHRDALLAFIQSQECATIGINKMTSLCFPTYHLWTNKQRYSEQGGCINSSKSRLMLSYKLPAKLIRRHHKGGYIKVTYSDKDEYLNQLSIKEAHIKGRFRTAGVLAIAIAHLMEAKNIWICGMDGYTLHNKAELISGQHTQHCYGQGYTDDADWKGGLQKDDRVEQTLNELSRQVKFKIITPTKFNLYYDSSVL